MCCFASVASFQAKFHVGPCTCICVFPAGSGADMWATTAGLSGLSIFIAVMTLLLSSFLLAVPIIYDKYDKFHGVARALRELRVGFIVNGAGAILTLLAAYVFSLSLRTRTLGGAPCPPCPCKSNGNLNQFSSGSPRPSLLGPRLGARMPRRTLLPRKRASNSWQSSQTGAVLRNLELCSSGSVLVRFVSSFSVYTKFSP